jgi:rhodanese-related sulfurtransferase
LIHLSGSPSLQQFTAKQLAQEQRRGVLILDTRPAEQFAAFHIAGSLQLGLMGPFASWAAILIKERQDLLLVTESVAAAEEAGSRLARVGFKQVRGFVLADKRHWQAEGLPLSSLPVKWSEDVGRDLRDGRPLQLIDVRSPAEWLKGHLPGATSLPLLELLSAGRSIDFSTPSLVYCHEGYRASTAASMLLRDHASDVAIMVDGIEGWQASGLPVEAPFTHLEVSRAEPMPSMAQTVKRPK